MTGVTISPGMMVRSAAPLGYQLGFGAQRSEVGAVALRRRSLRGEITG